ncbi:MAG TPA: hypothetical protein VNM37_02965, partial [Candidatus Dormibacteraeota bacterium]|nr:hypothetical protein [Candidatus Dormibacteraeota bacterium]
EAFVTNLHAHPQFKTGTLRLSAGADPVTCGVRPTIQFDYEHASEMPGSEGDIPQRGAPAPAWVCDVQVRDAADGSAQLWALAKLGQQIRGQIGRNEYRFTSIAFDLKHPNWVTGEDQGPTLTSIAFTNHPFLKNLESYAAANRRPGQVTEDRIQPTASGNEAPVDNPAKGTSMNAPALADFEKFRTRVCTALHVRTTLADEAVIDAATEAAATGGGLKGILEGLGVKDADNALKVIPELMAARAKLAETMQELDQLLQGQAAQEAQMADGDIAAVLSAKKWGDELKPALLADRNARMLAADGKAVAEGKKAPERIKAKAEARAAFLKEYGATATVETRHLTLPIVASRGGLQLAAPPAVEPSRVLPADNGDAGGGEIIDLRAVPGANPFDRLMRHLDAKDPAFKKLTHYQRCRQTSQVQA